MKKIKTNWDMSVLYKGNTDPQIKKDIEITEKAFDNFVLKYSNTNNYLKTSKSLLEVLKDYENLLQLPAYKLLFYFRCKLDLNSLDNESRAKFSSLSEWFSIQYNKIIFFTLSLSKIDKNKQGSFLNDKTLSDYKYFLKCTFDDAKHNLSEKEEQLFNLLSLPAHSLWVNGNEKILNSKFVVFKGNKISIPNATEILPGLKIKDRYKLYKLILDQYKSIADFSQSELNAIVITKKIEDSLRGFKKPYESTILRYQNEINTVESLVDIVTKNFKISHRFYTLKAKMMKLKTLKYVDRNASVGSVNKKISFDQAYNYCKDAFDGVNPLYGNFFVDLFSQGCVDVYPKIGKRGGAYCAGGESVPIRMLLNHVPDTRSVTVLAHEMGHAFHTKLSENQKPLYRDYSIATAEVASTLFENFVFDEMEKTMSKKEKIIALHNKISDSISTIFRQVALFNFENDLHTKIKEKGELTKEEIVELLNRHMQSYLGPEVKVEKDDGYTFVPWMHIRRFFYAYSYAFGALISDALYMMYKKDHVFESKIREFLKAGGSASPEDIFASIGIDIRKPEFFELGLKKIEKDIEELERLTMGA